MIPDIFLDTEDEELSFYDHAPKMVHPDVTDIPKRPDNTKLFYFTESEERAMRRAIRSANKFMEKFGKPSILPYALYELK